MSDHDYGVKTGQDALRALATPATKQDQPIPYSRRVSRIVVPLRRSFVRSRLQTQDMG